MLDNFKNKIYESAVYKKFVAVLSFCFNYFHKKFLWGAFAKLDEKLLKFLFVGFLNTLFSYFLYALFVTIGFCANLSLFFQYILGILWNFKTTGSIVFKNHDNRLIFKFFACYIFTFFLNSVCLKFLVGYMNNYLAQAVLVLPIALISFIILKFFVFNNKN